MALLSSAEGEEGGEKAAAAPAGDGSVSEDDIKLVMAQTDCSREKAEEALKAEKGDLINASESSATERSHCSVSERIVPADTL